MSSRVPHGTGQRPAVLLIAATDSSGGAGLTRDVRVLTDFGVDALCVVTAVTAQSDRHVAAVHHVPPEIIRAQIAAAFATRAIGAIKVGMLGTAATVEAVVQALSAALAETVSGATAGADALAPRGAATATKAAAPGLASATANAEVRMGALAGAAARRTPSLPIVVDPVLVSTSGGVLLDAAGRAPLLEHLFPLAALITPNVPEVAALLDEAPATDEAGLIGQGRRLLQFGAGAILLKGGHAAGDTAVDLLIRAGEATVDRMSSQRLAGSSRGTGCALASAIAAGLALGKPLPDACRAAKSYVLKMLTH